MRTATLSFRSIDPSGDGLLRSFLAAVDYLCIMCLRLSSPFLALWLMHAQGIHCGSEYALAILVRCVDCLECAPLLFSPHDMLLKLAANTCFLMNCRGGVPKEIWYTALPCKFVVERR